jgi:hypothetical protein
MFGQSQVIDGREFSLNELKIGGNETFSNGPFGSDLLTSELTDEGVPVIYIRDIRNGTFKWKSDVFVTEEKAKQLINCQVKSGDVLIAKVGDPPGISAIYPKGMGMGIITQDVIRVRLNQKLILPSYFSFYLNSDLGKALIKKISIEGTRNRFALGDFKKSKISVPSIALQNQFAAIVEKTEALKNEYTQSLKELEQLFGSLSQRAFKGELELSKLDIAHLMPLPTEEPEPLVIKEEPKEKEVKIKPPKKEEEKPESKRAWDEVSSQGVAEWVKKRYRGYHFSSEMLLRFLQEKHLTIVDYHSSEELKKSPQLNGTQDFKEFIFSAVSKENPFLKLEQVFYNAEEESIPLQITEEDFELIKNRSLKERSGIYFKIIEN